MASPPSILSLLLLLLLLNFVITAATISTTNLPSAMARPYPRKHVVRAEGNPRCESWKFAVEVNAAGSWKSVPRPCIAFVRDYFNGDRYLSDSRTVVNYSLTFANSVNMAGKENGRNAWVFDVDETLLSNLPYYRVNGYGSEAYNNTAFNEWVNKGLAPPLPMSLRLYKKLKHLGFKIFLLTGRGESQRNVTQRNLLEAGYFGWDNLIFRGPADEGKKAAVYKSEKRAELVKEGYVIQGSLGDQWSDLIGFALPNRSFKLPNPMYYIP
ncbi:acid phosphatase 1-like [Cucumis melo var. makuwa]|uniref:Acid phosphatase 1-like n=2 Tax=Cucumis melo TaxID=3656 RepID=A0A1S3C9U7_CUCME|nr:acid phosphatase 1-like [Cucumis melo]KAA0061516.1 acid phosphatase 1-like [Cucumis melo var. makuwa]TYK10757.1 acid phosphatase 1-like [Cucumis melo var. makuwa]